MANSSAAAFGVGIMSVVSWSGYGKAHTDVWALPFTLTTMGLLMQALCLQKEF